MIAGLFLRNFKTYERFNFIPFTDGNDEKLNLFIGNNGAGKSSVLEALDVYFNGREFILNDNVSSREASITPVFLVPKEKLINLKPELLIFANYLSDFLWTEQLNSLFGSNPSIGQFVEFRDNLISKNLQENYFLLIFGHEILNKDYTLISIDPKAIQKFSTYDIDLSNYRKQLNLLCSAIKSLYNYIYIPVETSITDFLKLEANGMQSLMNKELKVEIESILSDQKFEIQGRVLHTKRNVSINQFINEKLKEYVENIEKSIQVIDAKYHFNREIRSTNVNPKDFSDVIINTFFSKRRLQKEDREIAYLSSGERKKALIDIAFSFIAQNTETEKEIILAIDEPESSLHISMCFEQYMRIEQIANKYQIQSFVTTHWYGGLPILSNGRLYHVSKIDNTPHLELFNLENYFEARKNHPDDINLKSFYDLTSSIVSSVRNNGDKWIIVEGLADKKYIEHYLPTNHSYKILPVGGCGIVKKIYEYLYLPLSQDEEADASSGKIYCLIDTDAKAISLDIPSKTKNQTLIIRRLQLEADSIKLMTLDQGFMGTNTETELEEALNPVKFYQSFEKIVEEFGDLHNGEDESETIKEIFNFYEYDENAKFSFIKGENTFLKSSVGGRSNSRDLKDLHSFFDLRKNEICNQYINLEVGNKPNWVEEIISFLN